MTLRLNWMSICYLARGRLDTRPSMVSRARKIVTVYVVAVKLV